jgi:hypothetical protein
MAKSRTCAAVVVTVTADAELARAAAGADALPAGAVLSGLPPHAASSTALKLTAAVVRKRREILFVMGSMQEIAKLA